MFDAARNGDEILLQAVDAGLPANLTNDKGCQLSLSTCSKPSSHKCTQGNTLLMLASYAGHLSLTQGLLARGADPNRLNDLGQSIIAGAVFKAHVDIVRALVEASADPRLGTPNAIQTAHMFKRKDLMELVGANEGDMNTDSSEPVE
jgi:ankyrin repeat protein